MRILVNLVRKDVGEGENSIHAEFAYNQNFLTDDPYYDTIKKLKPRDCCEIEFDDKENRITNVYFLDDLMAINKSEFINDFGFVINQLKKGRRAERKCWNGKDMYIELQRPNDNSKMTKEYIYMKTAKGDLIPWLASQEDMLSTDWKIKEY